MTDHTHLESICAEFFEQADGLESLLELFEFVPEIYLFVKDAEGRFVFASEDLVASWCKAGISEFLLTTDHHHSPPALAESYAEDDRRVMVTGEPMKEKLELCYWASTGLKWMITSKFPVMTPSRDVIGVCGVIRECHVDGNRQGDGQFAVPGLSDPRLAKAVEFVFSCGTRNPSSADIAKAAGVSARHLGRLFQDALRTTPKNFVTLVKLETACRRLTNTEDPIVDIALDSGFGDQSSFTSQFRRLTGLTPRRFRQRW